MKSTQSCISAKRKGKHTRLFTMLGGLLLMFPLLLPASALAAPRSAAATPPLTQPRQIVDLAGVSVVRLALEYLPAKGTTSLFCTTLGTIIASWPAQSASDKNNWVLTDGSLLNVSAKNTCAPGGTLASILLYASNGFTNTQPASAPLGLLTCTAASVCHDTLNGTTVVETILTPVNNAVLFSFHTANPLPYVDVEKAATTGNPSPTSIELANSNHGIPRAAKNVDATTLEQFLTPIANATVPGSAPATPGTVSTQSTEPGMPFIDGNGKITGMQLSTTRLLATTADIENLETQLVFPQGQSLSTVLISNTLSKQWDAGIIDYEQGNNRGAVQTLGAIQNAPPAFQAPAAFIEKAQSRINANNATPTSTANRGQQGNPSASSFSGIPTVLYVGLITAVLVLVSLFLLVSIVFSRRRVERKRELEEFEDAVNKARQGVERKEIQQDAPPHQNYPGAVKYPAAAASELRCPNCNTPIDEHAAFCPNCRYPLKSTDTESRRYPSPPAAFAPTSGNARPVVNASPAPEQHQQPAQAPKIQDDPVIQATLERLWDKAGR